MSIFEKIKNPPKEFSPAAFWFWYGVLNPDELRRQIDLMVEQGVYNGFMHPRAYLKTPYLEKEWWEAVSACVDEGNKTGFYPWIYDEYAWPSGTAGSTFGHSLQKPSRTLAQGRKNMAKSLVLRRFRSISDFQENKSIDENESLLCLFSYDKNGFSLTDGGDAGEVEIFAFYVKVHTTLVDYMNKETIREFMNYTHEEYKKRYGEHFGNRIPGIFFDEIYMNHFAPWTDSLPEEFESRRGYSLLPCLYALAEAGGEKERRIRRDFYKTVAELYEEAFFGQIGDWCEENGLRLTGHTEEELWLHPSRQGNYFDTIRHLQIPGADCHDYRYRYPRKITYREPKLAVSVSRAYGKERAMSEAFGGAGWACTLQEFKRGVNTAAAMGISMFTLHGFYSDINSQASQSDWPGNFFFQNPYWRYFRHFSSYISRICYINSLGKPVVDVALYYPIEYMQGETYINGVTKAGKNVNSAFNSALSCLIENQIDVDMIDSEGLMRAEIDKGRISVGHESFSVLLIPEGVGLDKDISDKLALFVKEGGSIIYYTTQNTGNSGYVAPEKLHLAVAEAIQLDAYVSCGDRNDLFVNHRRIDNKDFYFVANSAPKARNLRLLLREKGDAYIFSPEDGENSAIEYNVTDKGTEINLSLQEDEGVFVVIDSEQTSFNCKSDKVAEEMSVSDIWDFLPLPSDISGEKQIKLKRTGLKIPIAMLSSDLFCGDRRIRIQNREGEDGYVGRHLSLWRGGMITRRVGWKDSSSSTKLYFRRSFNLDKAPDSARVCIAAINEWQLYINGEKIAASSKGLTPSTLDVSHYLRKGENVIAVAVYNGTPLSKGTFLQGEEPDAELLISLIAELEITVGEEKILICTDEDWAVCEAVRGDWSSPDYIPAVSRIDPSTLPTQAPALKADEWSWAWERGKLPLRPFGDMPLFGEHLKYPQRVCYSVELPRGTASVKYPWLSGEGIEILIDGKKVLFDGGACALAPDGKIHNMQIILSVSSANDGLHAPIDVELVPARCALCDWRLHGLEWYSGFASYKNCYTLSKKSGRYLLDLGKIYHQAEVWINGKKAGERVWAPYSLDITGLLKDGDNEIAVIVGNSAGVEHRFMLLDEGEAVGWNRYWNFDNIQRESEKLTSGMIGPVRIIRKI